MNETNKIEYKLEFTSDTDIEKEVIAFLNYKEGGFVYIGIDKDGDVVGVDNVDDCMLKIKDRLKNNISPSSLGLFDISQEYCCGVKIIKITIASGLQKPYYKTKYGMTSKGCFIRVGTAAEPMSQTLIEKQFARRVRNSIGEITSSRQELTFAQLRIEEFFTGISIPRNRELMRVFRDLELVESLGSGIPRLLKAELYDEVHHRLYKTSYYGQKKFDTKVRIYKPKQLESRRKEIGLPDSRYPSAISRQY